MVCVLGDLMRCEMIVACLDVVNECGELWVWMIELRLMCGFLVCVDGDCLVCDE